METILQQILDGQTQIVKRLDTMDHRLDTIENSMVTKEIFEKSYTEGQKDIVVLLERTAAIKDSIATISASIDVLNTRTFQQETKLRLIEIAR